MGIADLSPIFSVEDKDQQTRLSSLEYQITSSSKIEVSFGLLFWSLCLADIIFLLIFCSVVKKKKSVNEFLRVMFRRENIRVYKDSENTLAFVSKRKEKSK